MVTHTTRGTWDSHATRTTRCPSPPPKHTTNYQPSDRLTSPIILFSGLRQHFLPAHPPRRLFPPSANIGIVAHSLPRRPGWAQKLRSLEHYTCSDG